MEDDNLYTAQLDGTSTDVRIEFTNSAGHNLEIQLYNAQLTEYDDAINTVGRIERTFTFVGIADSVDPAFFVRTINAGSSGKGN